MLGFDSAPALAAGTVATRSMLADVDGDALG